MATITKQNNNQGSFLPDFCNARMAFIVIVLAELLAIILTLTTLRYSQDQYFDLAIHSLFVQIIAMACAASLCLGRRFLNQLSDPWAASLSYVLVLLVSFFIIQLSWLLNQQFGLIALDDQSFFLYTVRSMGITAITSALALRYFYIQHQLRLQIQAESRARIDALQARIRPHFLFNCMNTIASLTRKEPKLAEGAIEDLADLFRASLKDSQQLSSLEKELALCQQYLSIEQHRLGDRLQCHWDIEHLPKDLRIPALTLQPLLENAIYHGIEPRPEGGDIRIEGEVIDQLVVINIKNPLPSNPRSEHHDGNHLAQENIKQRLTGRYGRNDLFSISETDDQYIVTIRIPLEHDENA